jgi:anaerobic selenocysteine-containing dehydrogenase
MTVHTRRSFCRFCHANCAMLVDVEDGKVASVRGDPEDPMFGGYTCIKGRQLPDAHNLPDRITQSLVRGDDGAFAPAAMAEALDVAGARLQAIVDEHGPHAVAVYCGTYAFQNSAGVGAAMAFAQGLGTRNFYTSVTLDQPAKVYTTARYGQWMGGLNTFSDADVALFLGNNPIVSHYAPPGGLPPFSPSRRLRDAKEAGLKLIVADPRESDVAALADIHLPVRPGEDPALLAGMIHVILKEELYDRNFVAAHVDGLGALRDAVAGFTPDAAADRAGVDADAIVAAARMFAGGSKGCAVTGTGPEMAGKGVLTEYLVTALNILCARFCQEGEKSAIPRVFTPQTPRRAQVGPPAPMYGEGFPKSRIRGLGMLGFEMPCNVMADEILTPGEGQIRALICIGGNPEIAFPNQRKVVEALDSLDLLVAIDVRMAATARRADIILAPKMCLEREDITNLSEWWYETPYARYTEALVEAPGDTLDEYEMLWELAKRIGTGMPLAGGPCPMDERPDKQRFLDLMSAGCLVPPSRVRADTEDGRAVIYEDLHPVVEPADPAEAHKFDLAAAAMPDALANYGKASPDADGFDFRLVSRRSRHRFNSSGHHLPRLRAKRTTNPAFFHPDDLQDLGLAEDDIVAITSPRATIYGVAAASDKLRRGVVSMAHAFGDGDAGKDDVRDKGNSTNRLVDETVDYDPLTGQSVQSAIPVRIAAA